MFFLISVCILRSLYGNIGIKCIEIAKTVHLDYLLIFEGNYIPDFQVTNPIIYLLVIVIIANQHKLTFV